MAFKDYLYKIGVKGAKTSERKLRGVDAATKSMTASAFKLAGAYFGVQSALGALKGSLELSRLAAQAENVERAFSNLDNSKQLLIELKEATKDTIPEIELMKKSLIGIDLGATNAQLKIFAQYARMESVRKGADALTVFDNILGGVLRGSTELLDNFGISLTELNKTIEQLAKDNGILASSLSAVERRELAVEAATKLMGDKLKKVGDIALTDAEKFDQYETTMANFRIELGKLVKPAVIPLVETFTAKMRLLTQSLDDWGSPEEKIRDMRIELERLEEGKSSKLFSLFPKIGIFSSDDDRAERIAELRAEITALETKEQEYAKNQALELQAQKDAAALKAKRKAMEKAREEAEKYAKALQRQIDLEEQRAEVLSRIPINRGEIAINSESLEALQGLKAIAGQSGIDLSVIGANDLMSLIESIQGLINSDGTFNLLPDNINEHFDNITSQIEVFDTTQKIALQSVEQFGNALFQAAIYGKNMGDAVVASLRAIAVQLASKAAVYMLMNLFTGGTASFAGFGKFFLGGGISGITGGASKAAGSIAQAPIASVPAVSTQVSVPITVIGTINDESAMAINDAVKRAVANA